MRGALAARWILSLWALVLSASPAAAIEFWDGRVQVHGYYETRMSFLWEDFQGGADIDMGQWLHVLNVEIEADIAPEGWGPFDLIGAFARVEIKYDCAWRHACSLSDNVDVWGDSPYGRLPQRLQNARRLNRLGAGQESLGDIRRYVQDDIRNLAFDLPSSPGPGDQPSGSRIKVRTAGNINWTSQFNAGVGPDGIRGTYEDPGDDVTLFVFRPISGVDGRRCLFGGRRLKANNATGFNNGGLLPHNPGCNIQPIGQLRHIPNPFDPRTTNLATGVRGGGALPLRPVPEYAAGDSAPKGASQGLFLPSFRLRQALQDGEFDAFDQNFTVNELQWNRGASQQDEKELKEAYLELEMFDSRLWVRAGKQTIVWGKTELFRNQDQWNPVDLGVGPLSNLEESRIGVWSARGIWSFYEVGPFEDVRLELAAIFDQFEPGDLPRCGESTTPLVACAKTFGLLIHGVSAVGLAGEIRPPNPWNSWKGIEVGARLEFRYDRFSIAFTDYYGYNDSAYTDLLYTYSRNSDPLTGRPRKTNDTGRCRRGTEDACLSSRNALTHHSANQQVFAQLCATTVGTAASVGDPAACFLNLWNSPVVPAGSPGSLANVFQNVMAGQGGFASPINGSFLIDFTGSFNATTRAALARYGVPGFIGPGTGTYQAATLFRPDPVLPFAVAPTLAGFASPLVPLTLDGVGELGPGPSLPGAFAGTALQNYLTAEQAALLGCGPFYGTDCDVDGIDLLNAEASVLLQSFAWFEGTEVNPNWDTRFGQQPGTVGFDGGPVCTRYDQMTGESFILPGCRGPGDPAYNVAVDGSPGTATHPFTGQPFKSELAAFSWNFQMLNAVLGAEEGAAINLFDPNKPFREDGCSFAKPQLCVAAAGLSGLTTVTRNSVRAGGNGKYGRRQFAWHSIGQSVFRYEKRNVLGFSMDFAEDVSKTNWGIELTWQEGLPFSDANEFDGTSEADTYNLTISVDRPTFINFLNANRTFFFNSQLFISYIGDYTQGFSAPGPWTFLWLMNVNTGYFQDRLLVDAAVVYDFRTNSGAFLPSITYRFTENFSSTFGAAVFGGRWEPVTMGVGLQAAASEFQQGGRIWTERGIGPVRDLDSFFFRLRYTF